MNLKKTPTTTAQEEMELAQLEEKKPCRWTVELCHVKFWDSKDLKILEDSWDQKSSAVEPLKYNFGM